MSIDVGRLMICMHRRTWYLSHRSRNKLRCRVFVSAEKFPRSQLGIPCGVAHIQRGDIDYGLDFRAGPVVFVKMDKSTFYMQASTWLRETQMTDGKQDLRVHGVEAVVARGSEHGDQQQRDSGGGLYQGADRSALHIRIWKWRTGASLCQKLTVRADTGENLFVRVRTAPSNESRNALFGARSLVRNG